MNDTHTQTEGRGRSIASSYYAHSLISCRFHRRLPRSLSLLSVLLLFSLSCLFLLLASPQPCAAAKHQKVLLKDVTAITLSRTGQTTGRRSAPVPQLSCVGGPCQYAPSTVLCSNAGFDGQDVLWKCKADLEKGIKLGQISVTCEGYEYPDDPYILRGSCGLEYTLEGRAEVEKHRSSHSSRHSQYGQDSYDSAGSGDSFFGKLFTFAIFGLFIYVLLKICTSAGSAGGVGGVGGGGGSYPGGFPPGGGMPFGSDPTWGSSAGCAPPPYSSASASSGPGFWSGMAGGSALGYMLGSRNRSNYNSGWGSSGGFGGGGFRSGGSSFGSSSSPSPSSFGTSSSSSFGGTRRR